MPDFPRRSRELRHVWRAPLVLALVLALSNAVSVPGARAAAPAGSYSGQPAAAVLERLVVKGRAPKTGYARIRLGQAWNDMDHNGCDTRNDILRRDLSNIRFRGRCIVETGVLNDPYTGRVISFRRGVRTSLAVQIDHVVALSDAWQKGAQQLSQFQRDSLANDPLNLLAVDGPTNEAKGDGDAATWLPPNKPYRCSYVARQIEVKAKYGLSVTAAEKAAMGRVLSACPGQTTP